MLAVFILLILARPFVSSLAFPEANSIFTILLLGFELVWVARGKFLTGGARLVLRPLAAFSLTLLISALLSYNKARSALELPKYISLALAFCYCSSLTPIEKKKVLKAIVFSGMLVAVSAIYQYIFGFQHLLDYLKRQLAPDPLLLEYINQKRAFSPFVSPGTLAGFLTMILPLVLTITDKDRWLIFTILSTALLAAKPLGAFLSLLLGVAVYLYLKQVFSYRKLLLVGGIILASLAVVWLRHQTSSEAYLPASSLFNRISYWHQSLYVAMIRPLFGVGIGNFNLPATRYAHNFILQTVAEGGLIMTGALGWFILAALKQIAEQVRSGAYRNESICIITALLIFLADNLTGFTFFLPESSMAWWALLGLGFFSAKP